MKKGLFLALEGIDGAGKTTQALRLKSRLEEAGLPVVYVKEPTGGAWGRKIREIAEKGRAGVSPARELEYFLRDREEDVRENIAPALARGGVVVADRYFYSTIAYQSVLGLDPAEIRRLNAAFPVPDLVILLEIPLELSGVRITHHRSQTVNLGYEQSAFLKQVKAVFDSLEDPNIVRVNADRDKAEVAEDIWRRVEALVERHRA
ncbi:MAG: dTMP kinase [Thermodesulfobacteriota bacterium]